MKKLLRISLKIAVSLFLLFVVVTGCLYFYISSHKATLLARINAQFRKSCNGTLIIGDIHPALCSGFPDATLSLDDVIVRDSLWGQHHRDLLQVRHIYVSVKAWSLLTGNIAINKLGFSEGSIHLFTDSNGYSNRNIFRRNATKGNGVAIRHFELDRIHFLFRHVPNRKRFDLDIRQMKGRIHKSGDLRLVRGQADVMINQCIFNELRGSFLKGKRFHGNLNFSWNRAGRQLEFPRQRLFIGHNGLFISALFDLAQTPGIFSLEISDDKIDFNEARTWLSPNISRHLDSFSIERSIKLQAKVQGKMKDQPNPFVQVRWEVSNNILHTPKGGLFRDCSFKGGYSNGVSMYRVCGDEQAVIRLVQVTASWKGIPFRSDSFNLYNLKRPRVECRVTADAAVQSFNNVTGGEVFRFDTGRASLDIHYYGSIDPADTVMSHMFGTVRIRDAAFTYTPRNLSFSKCQVQLELQDQDIIVSQAQCYTKGSQLQMTAAAHNFLGLYRTHPEKIMLKASLNSSRLNLDEFRSFLDKRKAETRIASGKVYKSRLAENLDKALDACSTDLSLRIASLHYRKFQADHISAGILLLQTGIQFRDVRLQHAGGSVAFSGDMEQGNQYNNFHINTTISNVAIDQLFAAFGNFGMQSLHAENIRGRCSLQAAVSGGLSADGAIVPGSVNGRISFVLEHGQLLNFRPLERMGRFAFRKKRLSEVSFGRISNTLTIQGNNILVPPMQIASNLIDFYVKGVYSMGVGTDLEIEIPLMSLSNNDVNFTDEGRAEGLRLRLRARDDANGILQFSRNHKDKEHRLQLRKDRQERKAKRRKLFQI